MVDTDERIANTKAKLPTTTTSTTITIIIVIVEKYTQKPAFVTL